MNREIFFVSGMVALLIIFFVVSPWLAVGLATGMAVFAAWGF